MHLGNASRRRLLLLFTLLFFFSTAAGVRVSAENGKGPAEDPMPDIDEMLESAPPGGSSAPDPAAAAGPGDDQDLEKALEQVQANESGGGAPPPEAAEAAPPPSGGDDLAELEQALEGDDGKAPPPESAPGPSDPVAGMDEDMDSLEKELQGEQGGFDVPPPERNAATDGAPVLPDAPAPTPIFGKNDITNLEFRIETGGVPRIVVSSRGRMAYRETRNPQTRQLVINFDNTETPERLQRAYDTSEFPGPVALFTLIQLPGATPTSKLIVQLREDLPPKITPTDRGLFVDFPGGSSNQIPKVAAGTGGPLSNDANIYGENQRYSGQKISKLEIKNADVQDVLRLIARTSGYSIVIGEDVAGKVGTLSLENVPWDQAFALVLQSKKLSFVREGNVLRVGTTSALKSEKEEALQIEKAKLQLEPLKTVLIPVSYAKAADLAQKARTFMSERGTLDTDARTNTVIVKDVEKVASRVQKLFAALDTQPPRVSISARIVEVSNVFSRQLGFQQHNFNTATAFSGLNLGVNYTPSLTSLTLNTGALTSLFQLGEAESKIRTLANPSVSVVANQTGTVSQSVTFFVPGADASLGIGGAAGTPTLRQISATLSLAVTPIVAGDGSIFLDVKLNNDIPVIQGASSTVQSRTLSTQVLVDNGDTALIGGIFQNTVNQSRTGVPFLMRVPILGFLFSDQQYTDNRNEIFLFLTAKILNSDETFKRTL